MSVAAMAGRALTTIIIVAALVVGVALVLDHVLANWIERRAMKRIVRRRLGLEPETTSETVSVLARIETTDRVLTATRRLADYPPVQPDDDAPHWI